jgi:hypothetical protein
MSEEVRTITVGQLRDDLRLYPDDCELIFGSGNLSYYRTKSRGKKLVQIEFNEDTSQLPKSAYLGR